MATTSLAAEFTIKSNSDITLDQLINLRFISIAITIGLILLKLIYSCTRSIIRKY